MSLEVLDGSFVFLGCGPRIKRAEVLALAGLWIFLL
jgi:hypothetical protein